MHGNRSGDLEGVQGTMNPSDLGCAWRLAKFRSDSDEVV